MVVWGILYNTAHLEKELVKVRQENTDKQDRIKRLLDRVDDLETEKDDLQRKVRNMKYDNTGGGVVQSQSQQNTSTSSSGKEKELNIKIDDLEDENRRLVRKVEKLQLDSNNTK